ncbi:hypothetical protein CK220_11720 [Mesorhizobium sp. WSM3860]|nr:hypothetical protein CK220_11720 [Mesorhizobium sp. WSM3860]
MGFYVRKSVSAGPFRFNFSSGGVGVSVGVKGLRIGTGPRGHYIHAGVGGLYYRGTLGKAGPKRLAREPVPLTFQPQLQPSRPEYLADGVLMKEIESGDVMEMRDETSANVLDDINARQSQTRLSMILAVLLGILGFLTGKAAGGVGPMVGVAAFLPGMLIGQWLDGYRRVSVLYYDLEEDAEAAYGRLVAAFATLSGCAGSWHVAAGGKIQDLTTWKRNAGASMLVDKKPTTLVKRLTERSSQQRHPAFDSRGATDPLFHAGSRSRERR